MIASVGFVSTIVSLALAITVVSPLLLVILLIIDWKKGKQW